MRKKIGLSATLWYIICSALGISLVALVVGLIVSDSPLKYVIGLYYGVAVSILRMVMLARSINTSVEMDEQASKRYMLGQYNVRMLLTVAALGVAAYFRAHLSIIALVVGLLIMQPAVYIANFVYEKRGGERFDGISPKKAGRDS